MQALQHRRRSWGLQSSRTQTRWMQPKQPLHKRSIRTAAIKELNPDVVVVGAGIIGLFTAQTLLKEGLSVALVERKQLCAGATGAGQGYIWMAHRTPDTPAWELAAASTALWKEAVQYDSSFAVAVEWQETGSLLLGQTKEEGDQLQWRHDMLSQHGIASQLLSREALRELEPGLALPQQGSGLLVQTDAQINGRKTAQALLESCSRRAPQFTALMDEPVTQIERGPGDSVTVVTGASRLRAKVATVIAAGVWSGDLLTTLTGDARFHAALQPRRGHLLEVARPADMPPVRHGMMELSYTKHYSAAHGSPQEISSTSSSSSSSSSGTPLSLEGAPADQQEAARGSSHQGEEEVDITFTATTSASGSLLIGSSREFSGWGTDPSPEVVSAIMRRAAAFLPGLSTCIAPSGPSVRVGLRPFAVGGMPMIGPVKGVPGLYVAAGHEGSGLCLGLGTAELLRQYITGATDTQYQGPPSLHGRQRPLHISNFEELLPASRLLVAEL